MILISIFRDVLDGIWYWLYLIVCIIMFFYILGIVADEKRARINKKLKEKKSYDIESGREAAIAAMESKQVLAVDEEEASKQEALQTQTTTPTSSPQEVKKEEPVVINSSDAPTVEVKGTLPPLDPVVQPATPPTLTPMEQARSEEPLVINSNQ